MEMFNFIIFSVLFAVAYANHAVFTPCEGVSTEQCTVTDVRIDPCKNPKHCAFKKGINASLVFDFTPQFVATKLKTGVYWPSSAGDVIFAGMNTDDGCTLTTCPTVAGQSQTLNYNLYIGKKLPNGRYAIKWKVWNEEDDNQMCCFLANIELKK